MGKRLALGEDLEVTRIGQGLGGGEKEAISRECGGGPSSNLIKPVQSTHRGIQPIHDIPTQDMELVSMVDDSSGAAAISGSSSKAAAKLARKRARDRRAQQAMRDRTKKQLDALRVHVDQLSEQVKAQNAVAPGAAVASPSIPLPRRIDEHIRLQRENDRLRQQLAEQARQLSLTKAATAPLRPSSHGIALDPSILEYWSSCVSWPAVSPSLSTLTNAHSIPSYTTSFPLSDRPDAPWHVPPTCPADRIMQPFFEEKRKLVQSLQMEQAASPISSAAYSPWRSAIQSSISKVAADLLETYSEIDSLPKKVACLYIISSVLNVVNPRLSPFPFYMVHVMRRD